MNAEGKLRYEKPDLTFWSAEQLNGIEAKMSRGPGGGGGGGSNPYVGSGSVSGSFTYKGGNKYPNKLIKQTLALSYKYSSAGPDYVGGYTQYTLRITGACGARLLKTSTPANFFNSVTISVNVGGGADSHMVGTALHETYSNPAGNTAIATPASYFSAFTDILAMSVGLVNTALGIALTIGNFVAKQSFSFSSFKYDEFDCNFGPLLYHETMQGLCVDIRIPAKEKPVPVVIAFRVPSDAGENEIPIVKTQFSLYGVNPK